MEQCEIKTTHIRLLKKVTRTSSLSYLEFQLHSFIILLICVSLEGSKSTPETIRENGSEFVLH